MSKKYLKGFSNFGYRPVTKNDTDGYTVDDEKYVSVPSAQSCSPSDNRQDFSIPADDGIWDSGSEWTYTDLEVTFAETELAILSELTGADFDSEDLEADEGVLDNAPEIAVSFSALRADGGYRLYRYWSAKCIGYTVSHQTKGQSQDAQSYTLRFRCIPRKNNGKIRATKDIAAGTALTWIRSFAVQQGE